MKGRLTIATVLLALLPAAAARADQTVYAIPQNMFLTPDFTMDQGEKITFMNLDVVAHDITASSRGSDGKPLFRSDQPGLGGSAPVLGTEFLTAGSYPYLCSIHAFMTGTITVTSAGTPETKPIGPAPPPSPPPASDARAPHAKVRVLDGSLGSVAKRRGLRVSVSADEAALFVVTARAGRTTLARGSVRLAAKGEKTATLALTTAGRNAIRRARSLRVTLSARASDAAGNARNTSASRTLRR